MNFYNNTHPYCCGIDLHARLLYVCILDQTETSSLKIGVRVNASKLSSKLFIIMHFYKQENEYHF